MTRRGPTLDADPHRSGAFSVGDDHHWVRYDGSDRPAPQDDRLDADGLVERRQGRDRRAIALYLTERGTAVRKELQKERLAPSDRCCRRWLKPRKSSLPSCAKCSPQWEPRTSSAARSARWATDVARLICTVGLSGVAADIDGPAARPPPQPPSSTLGAPPRTRAITRLARVDRGR